MVWMGYPNPLPSLTRMGHNDPPMGYPNPLPSLTRMGHNDPMGYPNPPPFLTRMGHNNPIGYPNVRMGYLLPQLRMIALRWIFSRPIICQK